MKKPINKIVACLILIALFAVSCDQTDSDVSPGESELGQIAQLEKAEGISFFKREFTYSSAGTDAILTIATRNEEIFENVIENLEVSFTPLYEVPKKAVNPNISPESVDSESTGQSELLGEELMIEFTKLERAAGVIGIQTQYKLKNQDLSTGRIGSHGYDMYVNHYSNHWPSTYTLEVTSTANRTGAHFYARWKWYQGYGSRTVCVISSPCSQVGVCAQDFDLYGGNCTWTWNVDGPYQMQAKIGWFNGETWTDSWTY